MNLLALGLVLVAPQEAPLLLPEAPAGWRHERLDFPLSFAPELEEEGFEELYFAPGMFVPESGSYFSYVLALRLERDVEVDEAYLERFLTGYYRGLCRAVGEQRGLALDLDAVASDVRFEADRFVARVAAYDAFVTGEPLVLRIEVDVHPGPRRTELLGLASPLPREAPVWGELDAFRERWLAARPAPVLLNHLYVVPDAETYAAVADSELFRDAFAVHEARRTVRTDITYEGLYFYGRHTYFELLAPSAGFAEGSSGVAFGLERAGASERVAAALRERGIEVFAGPVTRALDGEQVPWFRMLGLAGAAPTSRLQLFSLEYVPAFLERWHAGLPPATGGIARRAVLERYAALLRPSDAAGRPLVRDVTAVDLALGERERERLFEACAAFGWRVEPDGEDGWTCDGPGVLLRVRPASAPGGVVGFELALTRPHERESLALGRLRVDFRDATALVSLAR